MGNQHAHFEKLEKKKFPFRRKLPLRHNTSSLHPFSASTLDLTLPQIEEHIQHQPHPTSCIDLSQSVDDTPRKLIHKFNDLKRQIWNSNWTITFSGATYWTERTQRELNDLSQKLEVLVSEIRMCCPVDELKNSLLDKCERLGKQLEENLETLENSKPTAVCNGNCYNATKRALDVFLEISVQLENIKVRILDYYGGKDSVEYARIKGDLEECLKRVLDVRDRGDLRIIVTREEYEDYIVAVQAKFSKIVQENERLLHQDKQTISNVDLRRKSVSRVKKVSLSLNT